MSGQGFCVALKVAATLWLITVSVWDHLEQRVPNWLVLPVMFGAFLWQLYSSLVKGSSGIPFVAFSWVILFIMWRVHIFGGGDTKFLMALFALFPTKQFLILFSLVVLLVSIPLLVLRYARTGLLNAIRRAGRRLSEGHPLPTADELQAKGRPHCWSLALPGVIYLWWAL